MIVNSLDDNAVYAYLLQTRPEGQKLLSESEQIALLEELRRKALIQTE